MTERIDALLREESRFEPPAKFLADTLVRDFDGHYRTSIADVEAYWANVARDFEWFAPWKRVLDGSYPNAK